MGANFSTRHLVKYNGLVLKNDSVPRKLSTEQRDAI